MSYQSIQKRISLKNYKEKILDTPEDKPYCFRLSRLHTVKGIDILLEAMVRIPDAFLWIAGSGPLKKDLDRENRKARFE